MRKIISLVSITLALALTACNNAPVDEAKASEAAAKAEALKPKNLGKFTSAAAANDAALTDCTKTGFKGGYFVTQPIIQEGKSPYDGMVALDNPCAT